MSLLPSATEILFAVGAGDSVVGVTFECDAPPEARQRTIVSTSALPQSVDGRPLTPGEIDAAVRERIAAGEDLYHLDRDALSGLDADVVVTQDLCAVCAVDVSEVHEALDYLGCTAQVVTTDPHTVEEVLASIEQVGSATGRVTEASHLVSGLRDRLGRMPGAGSGGTGPAVTSAVGPGSDSHGDPGTPPVSRPRMLVLEWTEPPFAPGHWVPEMVQLAGADCVLGSAGQKSVATTWEQIRAAAPEVVVVAPCGYHLEGSAELARALWQVPEAAEVLAGVDQVWAVDANASFARPGPRIVDGIEALAAIVAGEQPEPSMAVRIAPPPGTAR